MWLTKNALSFVGESHGHLLHTSFETYAIKFRNG